MGIGDLYHEHPLQQLWEAPKEGSNCFRCDMPVTIFDYGCTRCNYFSHDICLQLPETMTHPFHREHPLTLLAPQLSDPSVTNLLNATTLCNDCNNPCLRFAYHCSTCQFYLHLKCFMKFECIKHEHPLRYTDWGIYSGDHIKVCGACGYNVEGFGFACNVCNFNIHDECMFLPPIVKNHHVHVHDLTFNHNFPDESKQVYCDRCEDRDGKELDRKLSYYFCKKCDYIAHVRCVIDLEEVTMQIKHVSHDHLLRVHKGISNTACKACEINTGNLFYYCKQCDYSIHKSCVELPSLVNHPLHQEHCLTLDKLMPSILQCTNCEFKLPLNDALVFKHPNHDGLLWFTNSDKMFRCNACGGLGKGFRMQSFYKIDFVFDIHLECFALPGKIKHGCHPNHPLFLFSSSTSQCCSVCQKESDPELWMYCCKECSFSAHLLCAATDLLSTLRSSIKNEPNYCAIIQFEETSFKWKLFPETPPENICLALSSEDPILFSDSIDQPVLFKPEEQNDNTEKDGNEHEYLAITAESQDHKQKHVLDCPCCKLPFIKPIVQSCVRESSSCIDSLTLWDEELLDDLYCPVCSILIFPPFYSCAECNSVFHEYCAGLPRQHITEYGHAYVLVAPDGSSLSTCAWCKDPITGFAYVCGICKISLDVRCAGNAPLLRHKFFNKTAIVDSTSIERQHCKACGGSFNNGTSHIEVFHDSFGHVFLHTECALLPYFVKHHIHKHTLQLRPDLSFLDDEYICDACEKDLNPNLWAYMCSDSCGVRATSHVTCILTSNKKCHFSYERECLRR